MFIVNEKKHKRKKIQNYGKKNFICDKDGFLIAKNEE